jgi:acyl transferase domain-containing protein/3-hydroxymyristoyl/3-hydroxydecanoyl-(acyl carrier protein) dehydratase
VRFSPIAIVGRACVLPGALRPEELWTLVSEGRDEVRSAPDGRWRVGPDDVRCKPGEDPANRTWSDKGGYVSGFEGIWDPTGFGVAAEELQGLDPLFHWTLHCAREALADAGDDRRGSVDRQRVGAVFGNLGFPSAKMTELSEAIWHGDQSLPRPLNRFMSSGAASLLQRALGLAPGAMCLDTACASSLYAIKLAVDQLHDGTVDLALAGAVNGADDLFIHVGFTALKAMSQTGQSRPFHAEADGLVPAEGAGFVALKRLADARRDGDHIYGIIRGIGLSNDGRGRGFLAPLIGGQQRALEKAYVQSGLKPQDISLLECHATGTSVGDATEIQSTGTLFEGCSGVPIGSLKSNMGHLITTAGVAGLIKTLEAIRNQQRPPSLHADTPNPVLQSSPFRVLRTLEPWDSDGPRIAGVSAFGFGGNNAHLLVSENDPSLEAPPLAQAPRCPVAIVGVGTVVGDAPDRESFTRALLQGASLTGPGGAVTSEFDLALQGLRFPPRDLETSLPQQLLLLKAAREAIEPLADLPGERTGVFVAMEPDVEVCRFGLRWRLPERLRREGQDPDAHPEHLTPILDGIVPTLTSAGVVGNMPNIPANRLNSQFDLGGESLSISAGEASGLRTLAQAHRALSTGELDAAVVGAVDLSCQSVHTQALQMLENQTSTPGDAAVVIVLKRLEDAERDGDCIVAVVHEGILEGAHPAPSLDDRLGRSFAAGGLRDLVAEAIALSHRVHTDGCPRLGSDTILSTLGQIDSFTLAPHAAPAPALQVPRLHCFAATDTPSLLRALDAGEEGAEGPCRLAILAADGEELSKRAETARRHIEDGTPPGPGVHFSSSPVQGELAWVFSGAGSAYAGMGQPLLQAIPELGTTLRGRHPAAAAALAAPWPEQVPPLQRLWSASALCQLHAALTQDLLGLRPDAVIGYSSGESNSLFATGTWTDLSEMISDARAGELFTEEIGGAMGAVKQAWGKDVQWETWTVLAPVDEVQALVDAQEHVYLSVIHSDTDCIVAGDAAACARICDAVGRQRCLRLHYDLAVHVPELNAVREPWLDLHRREVCVQPDVRIYSGGHGAAYTPSEEACAEAILSQANQTLDFRKVIEAAWQGGVRIFVEHGPQGSCSRWIRDILGDREAVVVPLDRKGAGLTSVLEAAAALWAAGSDLDLAALIDRITPPPATKGPSLRFSAHPPAVEIPPLRTADPQIEHAMQTMSPAPSLVPITQGKTPLPKAVLPPPVAASPGPAAAAPMAAAVPAVPSVPAPMAAAPAAQATPKTLASQSPHNPILSAMHQQIIAMGVSEQAHIAQQTALHQRFLAMQSQAMLLLTNTPATPAPTLAAPAMAPVPTQVSVPTQTPLPAPIPVKVEAPPLPKPVPVQETPKLDPPAATQATAQEGPPVPTGPTFDRAQLEIHSTGRISEIFGESFKVQDDFHRQVRMPEPPLLLADRITGLDAELGSMGKGTIWSETDVTPDAWYLHQGHMPAGIMIESGQADLMLISYLGVDFTNRNDRVYRLLGCELTYHKGLPEVGETLSYDIHMDGHATQGDVRLMFFHYDCRIGGENRLSVRKGQAGFFTDAELADSDGCLWTPEEQELVDNPRLDAPAVDCTKSAFSAAEIEAFADGRPWECFGPGYERTQTHTRTPRVQNGQMLLLGPVTDFDPKGGPWGRGYMKSTVDIQPDTWFFDGHFKNDPCMPGTLMFEGCLQLMSFYLSALGYTNSRDGWRFEPVSDIPFQLGCRGQVTPQSKKLTYELFVEEVHDGPVPKLYADLLCTVDGLKAFHARRVAVQLTPAWPLDQGSKLLENYEEPKPVAKAGDFPFDFRSLVACANGRPSEAFGPIYERFDAPGRVARLPNPPYLFLSRVTQTKGEIGSMAQGMEVEVEYDIPPDAWYFDENGCRAMPFAVLLEAALQPCGWLASYLGCALTTETELCFRNLDGVGTLHVDLLPDSGTLVTRVKSTGISKMASMIIVNFEVECTVGDTLVYELQTVFGFFPQSALENQVGLSTTDEQRAVLEIPTTTTVDLTLPRKADWNPTRPELAEPMLLMLDRVTHFDPEGGASGLGEARGEKDVNPAEWFFKAHFFQDPVQPGSLGIEAMIQLLQWTMLEKGLDEGIESPRFETLGLGEEMTWKYRGQVIPENKLISSTLELTEIRQEEGSVLAVADASLWVDGKRIYEASGLGMRIVSGGTPDTPTRTLDADTDTWLADHCPTWTQPALPMMSMVDLMAQGACTSDPVTALRDVRVKGWLAFDGPQTLRVDRDGEHVRLVALDADGAQTEVATARVQTGTYTARPAPLPPIDGEQVELPYETGHLFHGPAFQSLISLIQTEIDASSILRVDSGVPLGRLNPGLLDAATHGIRHDAHPDKVAYPALIPQMNFYGPTPTSGTIRCEVRADGHLGSEDFPAYQVQLIGEAGVWCSFRLVEARFDKGTIGRAPALDRRAFLRDRAYVPGIRLSTVTDGNTHLTEADAASIDWLPGTVAEIYGSRDIEDIAKREHIAAACQVHPGIVPAGLPLQRFSLKTERKKDAVKVSGDGHGTLCLDPVVDFWTQWFSRDPWPVEDLYYGLIERFLGKVVLTDPAAFEAVGGQSLLYLGNHQVGVESLLFSIIASGLGEVPTVTLAKAEHRHTWLGKLIEHCFTYPGVDDPRVISFFDRDDKASLPKILGELAEDMTGPGRSVMVHIEGTRSLDCTTPVQKMSGAFIDMAMAVQAPVVPIRFVGALPRETMDQRIEFPIGMGRQDIYIGRPIHPEELAGLHYGERKKRVISAINALGPSNTIEQPNPGDAAFSAKVDAWKKAHGVSEEHAVLGCVLTEREKPTKETEVVLGNKRSSKISKGPAGKWLAQLSRRIGRSD